MARYRFSIDMGALIGVRHISVTNESGTPVPGIFIPTGINGIRVQEDKRAEGKCNQSGLRAFLSFQQRSYHPSYLASVRQTLQSKGEVATAYNVPAWQVCYTLPEEVRTAIRASLKKRVLVEHPDWANQSDIKGSELSAAISRMMPYQIGDSYLIEEQPINAPIQQTSAPMAQQVSGYTSAVPTPEDAWSGGVDELPF